VMARGLGEVKNPQGGNREGKEGKHHWGQKKKKKKKKKTLWGQARRKSVDPSKRRKNQGPSGGQNKTVHVVRLTAVGQPRKEKSSKKKGGGKTEGTRVLDYGGVAAGAKGSDIGIKRGNSPGGSLGEVEKHDARGGRGFTTGPRKRGKLCLAESSFREKEAWYAGGGNFCFR